MADINLYVCRSLVDVFIVCEGDWQRPLALADSVFSRPLSERGTGFD